MKAGDLVRFKNLHPSWGSIALITRIHKTDWESGQVYLCGVVMNCAIPWLKRHHFMDVISEDR
jgi:hypothetical protein